jgi:hypothetical protein
MEFTCAVWYEDVLAHYHISEKGNYSYVALLLTCITKQRTQEPPKKVHLYKKGNAWAGDHDNREFLYYLSATIEQNIACNGTR